MEHTRDFDLSYMIALRKDILSGKDFNEYRFNKSLKIEIKEFRLFNEEFFDNELLHSLDALIHLFSYYETNGVSTRDVFEQDIGKIVILQSIPSRKKKLNLPSRKILALNELQDLDFFWVNDKEVRDKVTSVFKGCLFYKKWRKSKEVGYQQHLRELNFGDPGFSEKNLTIRYSKNSFLLHKLDFSLKKIKEYISFRRTILKQISKTNLTQQRR